ncbi:tyrosine-type recombinase/integrase [Paenibacillus sp. strain BS8-2]
MVIPPLSKLITNYNTEDANSIITNSHISVEIQLRVCMRRILPAFQHMQLEDIKPNHIVNFLL